MTRYAVSRYIRTLQLDDRTELVGHPFLLESSVLEGDVARVFNAVRVGCSTLDAIKSLTGSREGPINQALNFLLARHFLLIDDADEESELRRHVKRLQRLAGGHEGSAIVSEQPYRDLRPVGPGVLAPRIPFDATRDLHFVIVGGCLTQFAADALTHFAPSYGIRATVSTEWPHHRNAPGASGEEPGDVYVFQPQTIWVLSPLWDDGPFIRDTELADRLTLFKAQLRLSLSAIRARATGRLLLVHGFSVPQHSPFGVTEFRRTLNSHTIACELNALIISQLKDDSDAIFIDEERLFSAVGKARLLDHAISIFGHHAPISLECGVRVSGPSRAETFGLPQADAAPRLLAEAYLDAYLIWSGRARIKCIIVDLDNTLWPAIEGAAGIELLADFDTFQYGVFAGIHQALKIVRQRGVLLATCSRNNEEDAQASWNRLEALGSEHGWKHLLRREDFAIHCSNWNSKSQNVEAISETLGISADAILFIDDTAAEREEVKAHFPRIRTLGSNLNLVRTVLLGNPCLQVNIQTSETSARADLVRAQLNRDSVRDSHVDDRSFLVSLNIRLIVTRVSDSVRVPRIVELLQRTNQFNTTLARLNAYQIREYLERPERSALVLEVSDRFADYGIVGVCLIDESRITAFALSCRVIALRPELPFLCVALTLHGRDAISASIVDSPRNHPCRNLYREAHFTQTGDWAYYLSELRGLPPIDPATYHIQNVDERNPDVRPITLR